MITCFFFFFSWCIFKLFSLNFHPFFDCCPPHTCFASIFIFSFSCVFKALEGIDDEDDDDVFDEDDEDEEDDDDDDDDEDDVEEGEEGERHCVIVSYITINFVFLRELKVFLDK